MQNHRSLLGHISLILMMAGVLASTPSAGSSPSGQAKAAATPARAASFMEHWTADNGNGTYSNPLFHEEFEDPDVIRVGGDYYLAGTTMHMNPGVQIMHSKDLVNWELAGYAIDRLDLGPAYRLEGGNIYGRGIWAPCIRYHQGMFYIFSNVNGAGLQVFRSRSIQGPWERNQLPGRHDLSVLFDDDLGKIFIISGASAPYPIEELAPDLRSFVPDVRHQLAVPAGQRMGEGHHLYKIRGKYFDISAIPGGTVDQMVASADSIDGPWTVERMVQGESLGVPTVTPARVSPNDRGLTLHQGGMVDTPSGEWWSIIMSDHGSAGRMVALVPITWDHDFPLIGLPGNLRKAPNTWVKPNTGVTQAPKPAFVHDDSFNGTLNPEWQWNHVPDDSKWSLTEKPGVLRLHSLAADNFYNARNSITQRPPATRIHHDGGARLVRPRGRRHGRPRVAEHALRLDRRVEDGRGHEPVDGHRCRPGTPRRRGHSSCCLDARHRRRPLRRRISGCACTATSTRTRPSSAGAPTAERSRRSAVPSPRPSS